MPKYVFRVDLKLRPVGEPLYCVDALEMFFHPGLPSVERCVHMLLAPHEICLGFSAQRAIMHGPKRVGFIRIVEEAAWLSGAKALGVRADGEPDSGAC
jgi:hypothetical protein